MAGHSVKERMLHIISRHAGDVLLRSDFEKLGSPSQVTRVLQQLVAGGQLARLGYGIYAKTGGGGQAGPVVTQTLEALAQEALRRLRVNVVPSLSGPAEVGATAVLNTGHRRISRQLSLGHQVASFKNTYSARIPVKKTSRPQLADIDPDTRRAARSFSRKVAGQYGAVKTILFGSRARRSHRPDSDADIAVILRGRKGPFLDTKLDLADLAYDVLLETGVLIQPLPLWEDDWRNPEKFSNPTLIQNIKREGVRI